MLKIDDHIPGARIIGLDRGEKRNAIGVELTLALEQILLETRFREDIRILVFHGIGGHFSAGRQNSLLRNIPGRPLGAACSIPSCHRTLR